MNLETLRTWAEVDLDVIAQNFQTVRDALPKEMKFLVTVKANAYGHGAGAVAQLLKDRVDYFALAAMEEAVELRRLGIPTPMLILGPVLPADYPQAAKYNITLAVSSLAEARAISDCAAAMGTKIPVHFAVDTGMSRIGFTCTEQAAKEIGQAASLPGLIPEGCFSHFAQSDSREDEYTAYQRENFHRMLDMLPVKLPICHLFNSAAIMTLPPELDMVRLGIVLYGLRPSEEVPLPHDGRIRPAMALRSRVSFVKTLPAGTSVSYGCTYVTEKESVIATVMAGYADGVPRLISNCGQVIIGGVKAPIVGRVCMDQFMVDVTHIPNVKAGDTVTIFGTQGKETVTADEVAEKAHTIGYEVICGITARVPRVYLKNGQVERIVRYLPDHG